MFTFFFPSPLTNCPISINNPFEKLLPEQAVFLCLCFYFSAVSEANEVLNKVDLQSPADSILGAGKKRLPISSKATERLTCVVLQ